jgi:hypothetical protein
MDTKRLSLSNLHEQIDSLRSSEWPTMKRYLRRQIVKCINECKTQACNAKKLVGTIKDHTIHKGVDRSEDDEDDDASWGSDFDDADESDDNDNEDIAKDQRFKTSLNKYDLKQTEDLLYEPVSDYMSDGIQGTGFKLLEEQNELNVNVAQKEPQISEGINNNENINGVDNQISTINDIEIKSDKMQTCSLNGVKGVSPKPSPRFMPKPPSTKPEVPKKKPQIIPRKPLASNGFKSSQSSLIKRPPSEPPPPPLPKSSPPASPLAIPPELQTVLRDNSSNPTNSRNTDSGTYEFIAPPSVPDDEYLLPIRTETPIIMNRKNSSSTISSLSCSTRDGDSPVGAYPSLSPQTSNYCLPNNSLEDDYEPFLKTNDHNNKTRKLINNNEENYEIVNDNEAMNGNCFNLPIGQRPLLPKVKDPTQVSNNKTKLMPDVFPHLPNWPRNTKDKKVTKQENDPSFEENANLDLINNNNSLGISARPLPPLPETNILIGNEFLQDYPWFHSVEREHAEALLMTQDQDGAYLVRESKRAGKSNPFTLTVFHNGRVFHLNIRKRFDGLYALGKEKPREKTFKTVADLVSYHSSEPILLTTRGNY